MPKPQRLPNVDEQIVLDELQVCLTLPCERSRWNKLVREHHYLKNALLVGEQLRYVVKDAKGAWLALMGWSAAGRCGWVPMIKGASPSASCRS